ncbi:hypothetical protein [Asaia astilbis]
MKKAPALLALLLPLLLSSCANYDGYSGGGYYGYPGGGWARHGWHGGYNVGPHYGGRGWGARGYRRGTAGPRWTPGRRDGYRYRR